MQFTAVSAGQFAVGTRGEIAVPAPARTSAGLHRDTRVAIVAVPRRQVLIVHPPALLTGLLAAHYLATGADQP